MRINEYCAYLYKWMVIGPRPRPKNGLNPVHFYLKRSLKYFKQLNQSLSDTPARTPVFLVGCQRSGTNIILHSIDKSPYTWIYNEGVNSAFSNYRLRPSDTINRLVKKSNARAIIFKPLCDSHLTDFTLKTFPDSKAIWIYRQYNDVIKSAVKKWQGHQKEVIQWIAHGDLLRLGWRGERLSVKIIKLVKNLYHDKMSFEEGAALFWYIRNNFYFELGLHRNARVLLIKYEKVVENPGQEFRRIFDFLNCPFQSNFIKDILPLSFNKESSRPLSPEVESLCAGMLERLDNNYLHRTSGINVSGGENSC